jgi:hypothetical protein
MIPEDIKKLVDEAVTKRLQEREQREGAPAGQYPVSVGPMTDVKVERPGEEKVPLSFGATGSGRLVYAKPFIAAPKAIVGGYMDIQYRSQQKASIENGYGGNTNGFDQQRFVPFIYADITEHVKMASELEIEHSMPGRHPAVAYNFSDPFGVVPDGSAPGTKFCTSCRNPGDSCNVNTDCCGNPNSMTSSSGPA